MLVQGMWISVHDQLASGQAGQVGRKCSGKYLPPQQNVIEINIDV